MQKRWLLKSSLSFVLLYVLVCVASADEIQNKIAARMKEFGAKSVGIYFEQPDGRVFTQNADEIYHAASTMKVPVMMEVFREVESGKLRLDQPIEVKNEFASIIDGSPFSLNVEDDSDSDLYKMIGQKVALRELVVYMITRSSNLATNLIIQLVTPPKVRELTSQIGAKDIYVLRGVEDQKAFDAGKINTTSARALAICLKAILDPKLFSEDSRKQMFSILESQEFRQGIPDGIHAKERNLIVANKTGDITEICHDAAIIRDPTGGTSILVILTRGVKDVEQGRKLIAALAGDIWGYYTAETQSSAASIQ